MYHEEKTIFETGISEASRMYLLETARWTKFLAILMFLFIGMMLAGIVSMLSSGTLQSPMNFSPTNTFFVFLVMVLILAFYTYPSIMLYRFSTQVKSGLLSNNQDSIDTAFRCQRNMYKFTGISVIILILLYIFVICATIFATV